MTQQGIVREDPLQRIGSAAFIIGAILMVSGGLLMPYAAKATNSVQEMLRPLGENEFRAELSSLLMMIGIWAIMIGVTGIYRATPAGTGNGTAWARLGFNFTLVGTAAWTVTLSQDVSTASAVAKWLTAPAASKEAAYSAVAALNAVGRGLYPMTIMIYWMAWAILGIVIARSDIYPRWLGWILLILGITGVAVGIIQIFTDRSTIMTLTFAVVSLLTALWALAMGVWVARRAW